jgi:hypothetical protein
MTNHLLRISYGLSFHAFAFCIQNFAYSKKAVLLRKKLMLTRPMKPNKIFIVLLVALSFVSCKTEDKKPEQVAEPQASNVFTVTLNATVLKDDSFQLFWNPGEEAPFQEENSMFREFRGSATPQDIVFTVTEDVIPNYLRLDFGTNDKQDPITVHSIKFEYNGKVFEAKGAEFFNYFVVNESTMKADKATAVLTPILSKEGTYDPITYTGQPMLEKIQSVFY